jgi:hypothetical protein
MTICQSCATVCHSGHKYFEVDDLVGQNFICECAKVSHKAPSPSDVPKPPEKKVISKKVTMQMHSTCPFMEITRLSNNIKRYAKDGKVICPFCMIVCMRKEECLACSPKECNAKEHYIDAYESKEYKNEDCHCFQVLKEERHLSVQNIDNLIKFFKEPTNKYVCDTYKLAYFFLSNETCFKYWESVVFNNEMMYDSMQSFDYLNQKDESSQYVKSCRLLNTINKHVVHKNYIELINKDFTLEFQFNFVNDLFSTIEVRDDIFAKYKHLNLKILRKCFILPKLKYLFYDVIQVDYNTNAFHRTLFKPHISIFFDATGLNEKRFFNFLNKIIESINRYFTKVSEDEINTLLKEYLKFLRLIFNFRLERNLRVKIIKELYKTLEIISSKVCLK